jgi:hypothetical protein
MTRTVSCGLAALSLVAAATAADAQALSGAEIGKTIRGKRVYLATPFGAELPLLYRSDGRLEGTGSGIKLDARVQSADLGRWWIAGARLCQKWSSWYDGQTQCFAIDRTGPTSIAWRRDDGLSGTARIVP